MAKRLEIGMVNEMKNNIGKAIGHLVVFIAIAVFTTACSPREGITSMNQPQLGQSSIEKTQAEEHQPEQSQPEQPQEEQSVADILLSVLNNEQMFITEISDVVLLKDYVIGKGHVLDYVPVTPTEYAFVDFDGDGTEELVVNISQIYGAYLILRVDEVDVYGYEIGNRGMQALKKDGSFRGSNGAASHFYLRLFFEDNKIVVIETAVNDIYEGVYEIEGKACTAEEAEAYVLKWDQKDEVDWIEVEMKKEAEVE